MTPRNNNASSSFKQGNDNDVDVQQMVPCLLHKKHKVVKLIRGHLENVSQEGIFTNLSGCGAEAYQVDPISPRLARTRREGEEVDMNSGGGTGKKRLIFFSIFLILLLVFGLIILMMWISAGPLSNTIPHTPMLYSSFIRTECLCSLEKKYLLRWSKPEYFE